MAAWILWGIVIHVLVIGSIIIYLNQQNAGLTADRRLVGRIEISQTSPQTTPDDRAPTIVQFEKLRLILWRQHGSKLLIESVATPSATGIFAFLIRSTNDDVGLWAHLDSNGNEQFDAGELSWDEIVTPHISQQQESPQQTLTVSLKPEQKATPLLKKLDMEIKQGIANSASATAVPIAFGEVVRLDDDRLAASVGPAGLWRPAATIRKSGLGIYFLERYDPSRRPLLLVHGAAGSAQDFSHFINGVDIGQWQIWLYMYPSGLRLDAAANALARILEGLHRRHENSPVSIVAHSMGGLVARSSVEHLQASVRQSIVASLVTVSTPWQGHPAARYGVHHAPVVLPSWHDMLPGSEFLQTLDSAQIDLAHLLIYGEKSRKKFYLPRRNDGTIGVPSATHEPIMNRAESVLRFELGHSEIIRSTDVRKQIMQFLDAN